MTRAWNVGTNRMGKPGPAIPVPDSLILIDKPRIEIGINSHLLTRHSIQGESGSYFSDSCSTLCDYYKLDNRHDYEYNQSNYYIASYYEIAKSFYYLSGISMHKDKTR